MVGAIFSFPQTKCRHLLDVYVTKMGSIFYEKDCVWLVGWSKLMMTKSPIRKKFETKSARPILIWTRYWPYLHKFEISDSTNSISWQGKFSKSRRNIFLVNIEEHSHFGKIHGPRVHWSEGDMSTLFFLKIKNSPNQFYFCYGGWWIYIITYESTKKWRKVTIKRK